MGCVVLVIVGILLLVFAEEVNIWLEYIGIAIIIGAVIVGIINHFTKGDDSETLEKGKDQENE